MQVQAGTGAVGARPAQALPCARHSALNFSSLGKSAVPATTRALGQLRLSYGGSSSTRREQGSRWAGRGSSPEVAVQQTVVALDLPGSEFLSTVQLELMPMGKGQAVVVVAVAEGSRAEQRGLTIGQRLKAVSDPLRAGTMWQLQDRPSLRFVKDTVRMKRNQPIDLEFIDFVSPETVEATFFSAASLATSGGSVDGSMESDGGASSGPDEPEVAAALQSSTTAAALDALLTGSQEETAAAQKPSGGGGTIADRLAQKYDESLRNGKAVSDVQKRIQRRKTYMEEVSQRNDSGLALTLIAAFLLPSLIILGVAYGTGYLDQLYTNTLSNGMR